MAGRPTITLSGAFDRAWTMVAGYREQSKLTVVEQSDDLLIQAAEGRGQDAVIVFNSLHARMAGAAPAEFLGVASNGGERPVIFVTDPTCRWFQGATVAERIVEIVRDHLGIAGAKAHLTLGTSMGGYGAAVFAKPLGARAALSIGAQYDVGPNAVEDKWLDERAAIDEFRLGPAGDHIDGATQITTVHGRRDRWHSRQFAKLAGVKAWIGPIGPHNIALPLKKAAVLKPLVKAAFDMDEAAITELMIRFGSKRKPVPSGFLNPHEAELS